MKQLTKDIIGCEVYTLDSQFKLKSFTVDSIAIFQYKDHRNVWLYDSENNGYDNDKVFASKRELLDHVMN